MDKIEALRENKHKAAELNRIIKSLLTPDMNDLSGITKLYETAVLYFKIEKSADMSYMQRKAFVAVILCLYCPSALIGGFINSGVKERLAAIFKVSLRNVNYIAYDLMFYYDHYADFRSIVDGLSVRLKSELDIPSE